MNKRNGAAVLASGRWSRCDRQSPRRDAVIRRRGILADWPEYAHPLVAAGQVKHGIGFSQHSEAACLDGAIEPGTAQPIDSDPGRQHHVLRITQQEQVGTFSPVTTPRYR